MCLVEVANATSADETGGICVSHSPSSVHASQPPAAQAVETCRPSIQAPALVTAFSPTAAIYNPTLGHACPQRVRRCPDMSDLRVLNEERRLHCSCPVKSAGLKSNPPNSTKAKFSNADRAAAGSSTASDSAGPAVFQIEIVVLEFSKFVLKNFSKFCILFCIKLSIFKHF